jgi:hypothetical protein
VNTVNQGEYREVVKKDRKMLARLITLQGRRKTIDELTADERQMLGGLFNENIRLRCLKSLLSDTIAGTDIAEVTEERSCEGFFDTRPATSRPDAEETGEETRSP